MSFPCSELNSAEGFSPRLLDVGMSPQSPYTLHNGFANYVRGLTRQGIRRLVYHLMHTAQAPY